MKAIQSMLIHLALAAVTLAAQTSLVDQGRAAIARGDYEAGIAILEKAIAQAPTSAEGHYYLALAYGGKAEKGGMFIAARYAPKARGEWEQAIALNPNHLEARFRLIEFYSIAPGIMGGSMEKALEQAKAIKAIEPLLGYRAFAFVYMKQNKPDLAKQAFTDALREYPNSSKAHCYLGQHFAIVEKNHGAAIAAFETALKLNPNEMPAYFFLGRTASLANSNLTRGEEALKKYLAYTPKENEPTLASAHYRLGLIYEKAGRKAEAKQSYQMALRLDGALKDVSEALKRVM